MDVREMKTCGNCKRDIPAVNFTIHTVHCARNIGMCPVCKEPFPHCELQEHHEKMHKLLPCKQCGDSVCGTDLEDHIRDSCAHTMQTCRYCNLEVRRGEMPAHERYCGARTEQCEECGEWVMLRYRRLHTESNHGFIRLDDDPVPFRRDKPKKVINDWQTNGIKKQNTSNELNRMPELRDIQPSTSKPSVANVPVNTFKENIEPRPSSSTNGAVPKPKRTNDQPQINTATMATNKVKNMTASRGAIKKRPAPKPPAAAPNPDPRRDLAQTRALQRQQEEERERRERSEQNLARGLPPILNPLEKLEKLRKMDALQNRQVEDQSYKDKLNGRVWMSRDVPIGNLLGAGPSESRNNLETERRRNLPLQKGNSERQKIKLKNLKPMTEEEFIERFNYLHMNEPSRDREDRFSQIKSSLRELRRGLNEVTAPYNANINVDLNQNRNTPSPDDEVKLPCEFCGAPVAADILVQHQTGCRPDLARLDVRKGKGPSPAVSPVSPPHGAVIPCEFCAKSLPVYLISEHQERCGRKSNLLFAD